MKKSFKIWLWIGLFMGVINTLWMGFNTVQYIDITKLLESSSRELLGTLVLIGLFVSFFSHIIISLSIIISLRKERDSYISGIILLVIGSISFISLFFHWGYLLDVSKEYPKGWDINSEMKVVWLCNTLHFSFIIYSIIYLLRILRIANGKKQSPSLIGEQLFVSLNIVGFICGIAGLLIILREFNLNLSFKISKWSIIPYCIFVFIPYLLMLSGWLIQAISDKKSGWYDEKQKNDIYRSSIFTLLISIPIMIVFFFSNYQKTDGLVSLMWLPFYLFMVLFIFSASSLYNFKTS